MKIEISSYDNSGALRNIIAQTMRHGDVFAEIGIIDDSPRSASAIAVEDTVCVTYTSDEMMDLLEPDPNEAFACIHTLTQRLRSNDIKILIENGD